MTSIDVNVAEARQNGGAAGSFTSGQKLQWEKQWLKENKSAFDVVRDSSENASNLGKHLQFQQQAAPSRISMHMEESPASRDGSERDLTASGGTPLGGNVDPAQAGSVAAKVQAPIESMVAGQVVYSREIHADARVAAADVEKLYRRQELRQSAVWRDGKNVTVSMRVPEELQEDKTITRTLRQWLADAGLELVSLIVNGKLRSRS